MNVFYAVSRQDESICDKAARGENVQMDAVDVSYCASK